MRRKIPCVATMLAVAASVFGTDDLRLMSFNLRHCAGMDGVVDYSQTAAAIGRERPDFAGLQEVDVKTARSGGVDQAAALAKATGLHATFARAIDYRGGEYGVAVLSCEEPLSVVREPLPGPEPRVLLLCEFGDCWFGTTHLDSGICAGDSETAHILSVPIVSNAVARCASGGKPVFLTGDWNATPSTRLVKAMERFLGILSNKDVPTVCRRRNTIDYIAVDSRHAGCVDTRESYVTPDEETSDHKPVIVSIRLSKPVTGEIACGSAWRVGR